MLQQLKKLIKNPFMGSEEREGKKGMNDIIESTSSLARASDSNESVERQNIPKPIINDVIMEVHSSSAS